MKRMRKVLSFVLILALILGSFSMAFAAETTTTKAATLSDIAGLLGEDQIEVCANLGIITGMPDGTYQGDKLVTRAEFAAIITRALGIPESALAGYATTSFNDTVGYGWAIPYLAFLQSKGIMIGDGLGNAMPGRTITVNEAMTMILRAIGYIDSSAELVGKWPANYVTLGKALSLYEDVSEAVYMDRENAAIAIYNAITIQLVSVNTDGKTEYRVTNDKMYDEDDVFIGYTPANLANTGLGCKTWINADITNGDFGSTLINVADKIGARGTKYTNKDDDLVAFRMDSTFLTGTIDKKDFVVGDKKYTINADITSDSGLTVYVNADRVDSGGVADVIDDATGIKALEAIATTDAAVICADGEVITLAAKVSGTTVKRIYAVVVWSADDAAMVSSGDVSGINDDKQLFAGDFVKDNDQDIDVRQFSLDGVKSLDDIKVDDVVYVYQDGNKKIRKVAVGQEVVEGVIDEANDDEFVIDGKTYEYADDYLNGGATAKSKCDAAVDEVGGDAVVNLDAYGYAFKIDATGGDAGLFAMVQGFAKSGTIDNAKAKLYTSEDSTATPSFVKNSKVKVKYPADQTGASDTDLDNATDGDYEGALIGYKLNSAGQITEMSVAEEADFRVNSTTVLTLDSGKSYPISKDVAVFSVGEDANGDPEYDVSSISSVDFKKFSKDGVQPGQYLLSKDGKKVIALCLDSEYADAEKDDVYGVINGVTGTKAGDDPIARITALINGSKTTIDTTTDYVAADFNGYNLSVDLWKFTKNGDGKAKEVEEFTDFADNAAGADIVVKDGVSTSDNSIEVQGVNYATDATDTLIISLESDAVVYKAIKSSSGKYSYEKSDLGKIKKDYEVWAYDTKKDSDRNGIATVVIWLEN